MPALLPLSPAYEGSSHGTYFRALESALTGMDKGRIRNIALTGSYGAGKSSILQEVARAHRERVVEISLSTLGATDEATGSDDKAAAGGAAKNSKTNRIQKEIVKQILYREDPRRTPGSRYRRISRLRFWPEAALALITSFALSLLFFLSGWSAKLIKLFAPDRADSPSAHLLLLLLFAALILSLRALLGGRLWIEKLSAGPTTLSLSKPTETYFDEYLDEIVYFFEVTKCDLVIFEDIDRFDDPKIFETLRALNTLLNGARQLDGRTVRFIYAIKDSIFDELGTLPSSSGNGEAGSSKPDAAELEIERANRTKFFDLVVPVVPFVTHRSARDLMIRVMGDLEHSVSTDLIDLAGRHIADMRLIKNVRNEFAIFKERVIPEDGKGLLLGEDSLFAMLLYKNVHLSDFERIRTNRSALDVVYRQGRTLVQQNIERLDEEARNTGKKLADLDSIAERSDELGTALIEHVDRVVASAGKTVFSRSFDGQPVTEQDLRSPEFWKKLVSSDLGLQVNARSDNYNPVTFTLYREYLVKELGNPLSVESWEEADRSALQQGLDTNRKDREFLLHADMAQLMAREEFKLAGPDGSSRSFKQVVDEHLDSELARQLVGQGYINRDFTLYTSTFHAVLASSRAINFIMHNVDPNVVDMHFELEPADVEYVLRERGQSVLRERSAYNVAILNHLLRQGGDQADLVVGSLLGEGEEAVRFLEAYIVSGAEKMALVRRLVARWPKALGFVVEKSPESVPLVNAMLENLSPEVEYRDDGGHVRQYIERNYGKMKVFSSESVEEPAASRVADLLSRLGARLSSIERLSPTMVEAVVAARRYEVTRENLVTALGESAGLALDDIRDRKQVVYDHVLNDLPSYLSALREGEHTVESCGAFLAVIDDVVDKDKSQVDAIVSRSSVVCVVSELSEARVDALTSLARHLRFPATFANVADYVREVGAVDRCLAGVLERAQFRISATEDADEEEKAALSRALLLARESLPDPAHRVELIVSLSLGGNLPADAVPQEKGALIGLLIDRDVIADDAESFLLTQQADWPTREFAISRSKEFVEYMSSAEVPVADVLPLLRSADVPSAVKAELLRRLCEFVPATDRRVLKEVAEQTVRLGLSLPIEGILHLARGRVDDRLVLQLLAPQLGDASISDLAAILDYMGGDYRDASSKNGKRPRLLDTKWDQALVQRLIELGVASSYKKEKNWIVLNMKRS